MTGRRRCRHHVAMAVAVAAMLACSGGDDREGGGDDASAGTPVTTVTTTPPTNAPAAATTTATTATTATTTTTTTPPEPLLAGLAAMTVIGPPAADAGERPQFAWEPVEGATTYRLAVLGPDGPIWAWEGSETSIWLGGFAVQPHAGATRLAIVPGTCWSVVARDADGDVIAASDRRPLSPRGQPESGQVCASNPG